MTNARKICLLLSFFLYILNASAQEEIKKDTTAQNSKGVLVNLTDGIATTVRHTGRKIRKVGKEFNAVDTTFISPNLYNLAFMLEHSSWYEYSPTPYPLDKRYQFRFDYPCLHSL